MVKRWTPLLFSCQISNNEWRSVQKGYVKQEQECFWPLFWSHHYRANGTVTSKRKLLVQAARTSDGTPQWCWTIQRITSIQPFSSASSSSVNTFRQATNIFASCSCSFVGIRVARPWLAPSPEQWTYLFFTSIVEYCCSGTVTVAADVTLNDVEADHLGSCCCPFVGIRVGRHWHIRWKNELIYSSLHLSHIAVVALWP